MGEHCDDIDPEVTRAPQQQDWQSALPRQLQILHNNGLAPDDITFALGASVLGLPNVSVPAKDTRNRAQIWDVHFGAGELRQLAVSGSFSNPPAPQLRFMQNTLRSCGTFWSLGSSDVGGQAVTPGTSKVNLTQSGRSLQTALPFSMLQGGIFRICWSDNGDFESRWRGFALDVRLYVSGLQSSCSQNDCLARQRASCHVPRPRGYHGSCLLNFSGNYSNLRIASWTSPYLATYDNSTGVELTVTRHRCGTTSPGLDLFGPTVTRLQFAFPAEYSPPYLNIPVNRSSLYQATTFAICYCPAADGNCNSPSTFTQQIGLLMLYDVRVCSPIEGLNCISDFSAVVAGQRFMLRVSCPPEGCSPGNASRIKLAQRNSTAWQLLPWDPQGPRYVCSIEAHMAGWLPRGVCTSPQSCNSSGGLRQDRRDWGSSGAWMAWEPESPSGDESIRVGVIADVCYCDHSCEGSSAVWFKAGEVRVATTRLGPVPALGYPMLQIVGAKGTLTIAQPPEEPNSLGISNSSTIMLISDPTKNATAADCVTSSSRLDSVPMLDDSSWNENTQDVLVRFLFNETELNNTIVVDAPGVVAVCYCNALVGLHEACADGDYFIAGRVTIRGPLPGHEWRFSGGGIYHLEYAGFGLDAQDTIRFSLNPCSQAAGNPVSAWGWVFTGCPANCGPLNENVPTTLLTDSTVGCDDLGQGCQNVRIIGITTGPTSTELEFSGDPLLVDGDEITIGPGVQGGTPEQTDLLQGRFPLQEGGEYTVAHTVFAGAGVHKRRMNLKYTGSDGQPIPLFTPPASGLSWARRNRAATRHELLKPDGPRVPPLHVCWKGSGAGLQGYTAEVGVLRFVWAPPFTEAIFAPAAPVLTQMVPVIIGFQTGNSAYPVNAKGTSLVVRFEDRTRLVPRTVHGANVSYGTSRANGTQAACGEFLLEAWSNSSAGFPLPKRCRWVIEYLQSGPYVKDFEIEFEEANGLAAKTQYQIVVNVVMVADLEKGYHADRGKKVLRIIAFDDLYTRPYQAIEESYPELLLGGNRQTGTLAQADEPQLSGLEVLGGAAKKNSRWYTGAAHSHQRKLPHKAPLNRWRQRRLDTWQFPSNCVLPHDAMASRHCGQLHL